MKTALYCLLAFALFATACKRKKTPSPYTQLAYEQTGCSDPWQADVSNGSSFEADLRKWLKEKKDIDAPEVKLTRINNGPACYACHCPTGIEITIGVNPEDVKKAEDLGFRKK